MKKLSTTILILCCACLLTEAQETVGGRDLNSIRKKFYETYARLEQQQKIEKEDKDGDGLMQQFRRWEYLMKSRTYPSGRIPDGNIQWNEWHRYQSTHTGDFEIAAALPAWQPVGTSVVPSQGGGAGRVNVIRFNPSSTNTIYVGTAGGGVWKSTNAGVSWASLTDQYPVTSIADIAIDPTNGNNIYVATGDGAGYEVGDDFWGGVYTAGILRSTDGGITWARAGKSLPQDMRMIIQRLVIHPTDNTILLAATRNGIYRSSNAGSSWSKVLNNHCYDMEWNTAASNTVYAGGEGVVYKSTDAGATWSSIVSGFGSGRMSIEVSASNAQVIYALTGSFLYRSTDGGNNWNSRAYPYGASFYGYYDLVLTCADANSDHLIAGGLNTVRSTNGGNTWTNVDNWADYSVPDYVHADKHCAIYFPGSTTNILAGTDGGVFKTTNGGTSWSDLSNGLMIAQMYRLGTTPQNGNLILSGWQDNGCNKWDGAKWTRVFGADGMEAAIDYTDQSVMYEAYQYGGLNRSYNGGASWTYIAPSSGDWVTPFVLDPKVNTRLYYGGYNSLYKSENRGNSWSTVAGGVNFGGYAQAIAVAPSNNNVVYAVSLARMYRFDIPSNTATDITAGLPVSSAGINYIAVSNTDPNKVWVALSGYSDGNKVYRSANGGATWTNVSGSLPNMPVNTIVYHNNSNDRVIIGTDVGVYVIDNARSDWKYASRGLPNVMVHELEINYGSNKLVAATYGRGLWQVDLPAAFNASQPVNEKAAKELTVILSPNPTKGILNISVTDAKEKVLVTVYKFTGEKTASYTYDATNAKNIRIDISSLPFGNYIVHLQSGDAVCSKTIQLDK